MKILIKRLYCTKDQKLVRGIEKKSTSATQIVCSHCGKVLRQAVISGWRPVRDES
jgi:transcription elongation factor Elf1